MAEAKKRLVIIDGKSVFYRGYYAMPNLSTKDGTPTGGVYGFAVLSLEVIKRLKPDYVCVAWDKPKTNIRKRLELYPKYKAGRKPAPPDFYIQIPLLHEYLKACNWPLYELDDYEADDIMCGLAKKAEAKGIETILISSDLDLLQCVSPLTHVYLLKKGLSNIEELTPKSFEEKYGIGPEQFVDLKSLKGDSSDNIPGVTGIGEKTALDLLKQYKTLDNVYENIENIKETIAKKLVAGRDIAVLSKQLVTLYDHAPIDLDLAEMDIKKLDAKLLAEIMRKFEFRSLLRQLPTSMQVAENETRSLFESSNGEISPDKVVPFAGKPVTGEVVIHSRIAGAHGQNPELLIVSTKPGEVSTIDLKKGLKETLDLFVGAELVGYDLKRTLKIFAEAEVDLPAVEHDVQMGAFLVNSLRRDGSLSELATNDLGYEGSDIDVEPLEELTMRAGEVTAIIRALHTQQAKSFKEAPKLSKLAKEIEWPVIPVIARMEVLGIELDSKYLEKMSVDLENKISDIMQTIFGHAGQEFNISSPQQLGKVLFEDLELPTMGVKKGKTGYSTAADVLDKLREFNPIIDCITQYREYTKLKSTYVDTLPKQVDKNNRLHTTFNMNVAPTGRLSSNEPNLQNIPVRTELGKTIREAFVAGPGKVLISADYSQFELRLAAVMAGDADMVEAFNSGIDIHTLTASQVFGVALEDVTKDMRYQAKAVNFGILYGQTPHGLAAGTGMSFVEAREFIDKYFEKREPLREYIKKLREQAYEQGYVETLFGRRRPTPDVRSSNFMVREGAYRQAVNMPIQGTEADLMKMAMIEVDNKLTNGCRQLLQIHDSILVECDEFKADEVTRILKETMENIYPTLGIKLKVDVSQGKNWGEL
ncbi:MAG: DNA polymerase I [Patescibacteria group bacterium]